jgi:hypothetical protein
MAFRVRSLEASNGKLESRISVREVQNGRKEHTRCCSLAKIPTSLSQNIRKLMMTLAGESNTATNDRNP